MGGLLDRSEELLEGMFEGVPMQLLGARVQPAQVAKRLERAMDTNKVFGTDGATFAPNAYRVAMSSLDYKTYASSTPYWESQFADYVQRRAHDAGWRLISEPRVELAQDETVAPGRLVVGWEFHDRTARPGAPAATVPTGKRRGGKLRILRRLCALLIIVAAIGCLTSPYHVFGSATEVTVEGKLYLAEWTRQVEDQRLLGPLMRGYNEIPELRPIARRAAERRSHIVVGKPSSGTIASYNPLTNRVTIAEGVFSEPIDVQVAILAEGLSHAAGSMLIKSLWPRTCLQEEVDARRYGLLAYSKIVRPAGRDTARAQAMEKESELSKQGRLAEVVLLSREYQRRCLRGAIE